MGFEVVVPIFCSVSSYIGLGLFRGTHDRCLEGSDDQATIKLMQHPISQCKHRVRYLEVLPQAWF